MSKKVVVLNATELKGMPQSRAKAIRKVFQPMADDLEKYEDAFNELTNYDGEKDSDYLKTVKRLRLDIEKIRIKAGEVKKEQKSAILVAGRAIDGVYNILKWAIEGKESALKEIETYAERIEEERLEYLQDERVGMREIYIEDAHERNLSGMDDDVWDAYFNAKKKAYEDQKEAEEAAKKAAIEAAIQAEKDAAEAEMKRKKELEAAQKKAKELEKEAAKRDAEEKKEQAKRDKEEKQRKAEADRKEKLHKAELKKSADAEIAAKKELQKKIEAVELAEKVIKEAQEAAKKIAKQEAAKREKEAKKLKEKNQAPDKTKLKDLAEGFKDFDAVTSLKTAEGKRIGKRIQLLLGKVHDDIIDQINKM